ncbi:hypothetical protein GmHk_06G017433 [Glycine max]|nr:hypothetical protein GmHk_06G017433 [Glycine max]
MYETDDGITFEGPKKAIQIKRGKYIALQICDDEDVEIMIQSFEQQQEMSVIELCVEVDVAGASAINLTNSLLSCGNNMSHNESGSATVGTNSEEDFDDDDYLISNSYAEDSLDEDEDINEMSDTDDEAARLIEPLTVVQSGEGGSQTPFWDSASHYSNINWSYPDQEEICGLDMESNFNMGQELYVGMEFDTKSAVKNALQQYVMKVHQSFKVVESKSQKYVVCCGNKSDDIPCPFYMRAILSKKTDTWKVTQWGGPHSCLNMSITQDHDKLDSDLIATCVLGMIKEDPSLKISLIQERINGMFNYNISYRKAWKAKQKAITIEYGDWDESYVVLPSWLKHMQNHSPGSYYQICDDDFVVGNTVSREHRQFHRVFWTFSQCKEAFKYCKPVIQVDGTFMYGKYRGTLLIATTQDGNSHVLPLAFAVVEGETLTAWSWFLAHLREHVTDKDGICLISDRHASIKAAVANEALGWQPPHAYHVYCVRHIARYTPCKHIFDRNFDKFCELSPPVKAWIGKISKEKWTMAYDKEGRRYGHMTTNLSECVNKVFKGCCNVPITALVKSTYSRCRKYFVDRGRQAQREIRDGQIYCSHVMKKLRENQEKACSHIVRTYDIQRTIFELCGQFTTYHYPCSHIIAACGTVSINFYQYIDVVYTNDYILRAYSAQWWPLGNDDAIVPSDDPWTLVPDPSFIRDKKGRPRSTRLRNEMDWREPSQSRYKCGRCGTVGHNRRNCPLQSQQGSC